MNQNVISKAIKDITRELKLSEPNGFMLSYDFNDVWLDISLEKDEYGEWGEKVYTISVSKKKAKSFRKCMDAVDVNIYEDEDRVYASLTQDQWEEIQDMLFSII